MSEHKQKLFINATALDQQTNFFLLLQKLQWNFKKALCSITYVFACVCACMKERQCFFLNKYAASVLRSFTL